MKLRTLKTNFIYAIVLAPFLVGCQNDEFKKELDNQKDEYNIIDLEKDYNGVNLETLLHQSDNVMFMNGSDALCGGENIIELFNFESTDESGQPFRTFSSKEEKPPLVITFNSDAMFASGFLKDKACKVAIYNKPMTESMNALKSMPTVFNSSSTKLNDNSSETALFVISTPSTEQSNASLSSPAVSDDPRKLLGNYSTSTLSDEPYTGDNSTSTLSNEPYTGDNSTSTPSNETYTGDLMDYIRGDKKTYSSYSIPAGYQGKVFATRGPDGNASWASYYLKKTDDANTDVFPAPGQDNAQWEFLGPYQWSGGRTGKVGSIYIYDNRHWGKKDLFRLKTTWYGYFPTAQTSDGYWEYLGDYSAVSNEPYTGDLMSYLRGDKKTYSPTSIAAGYQGKVFGTRGPDGNASYVNYYLKKTDDANTDVFPTPEQDNAQWAFLGPYIFSNYGVGKAGRIYIYENPHSGKTELFRLKTNHYRWFPTNRTSNEYWEFLGDLPARRITVKLFRQNGNLPIPHEIGWAWNSLVNSMKDYVTNKITFVRADQGNIDADSSIGNGSNTDEVIWQFKNYLTGRFPEPEPYTMYGLINHGFGGSGEAAINSYSAENFTPSDNFISTNFPFFWSSTILGNTSIAHEVSTLLGAKEHNEIFYEKWWSIFGIWYRDIMSNRSEGFVRYDRHKNAANIKTMRHNLMV